MKNGILVTPDYKNTLTESTPNMYGYNFRNSRIFDPIKGTNINLIGTIHTHPVRFGETTSSAYPSIYDINSFSKNTPNIPFIIMGWDVKLHAGFGDNTGYTPINLPKNFSTVQDILNGRSLIQLLIQNANKNK